jgi:hypothetical protein
MRIAVVWWDITFQYQYHVSMTKNSELEVASDTSHWSRIQNLELEQAILRYILWLFYDMFYLLWYSEVNLRTQLSQVTCRQCLVAFRGATSSKGHFSRITTSMPRLGISPRERRISKPRNHKKPKNLIEFDQLISVLWGDFWKMLEMGMFWHVKKLRSQKDK